MQCRQLPRTLQQLLLVLDDMNNEWMPMLVEWPIIFISISMKRRNFLEWTTRRQHGTPRDTISTPHLRCQVDREQTRAGNDWHVLAKLYESYAVANWNKRPEHSWLLLAHPRYCLLFTSSAICMDLNDIVQAAAHYAGLQLMLIPRKKNPFFICFSALLLLFQRLHSISH